MDTNIEKVLKGSIPDFCEIVKTFENNIYNYLYRLCKSKDDALDLTQETFLKAYKNLHRLKAGMDIKPYLYRIAHNNYIDYMRMKKETVKIDDEQFSDAYTPEETVVSMDTISTIKHIIDALPISYRSVFLLRTIDDLSFKEVGSILKISENNARMTYMRARKKIAMALNGGELF